MHDDAFYVPNELFEEWARRDPIERFRKWLHDHAELTDEEEAEIPHGEAAAERGARTGRGSPLPDPATLLDGVFASADELDTPTTRGRRSP